VSHLDAIHSWGEEEGGDKFRDLYKGDGDLKGLEAIVLEMDVKWPVELVVSKKAITKYQLLFRHLFFAKHVEMRLRVGWKDCMTVKRVRGGNRTMCLRARMLHFASNFVHYVMFEVVRPQWIRMEKGISEAGTVDRVIEVHGEFLDTCLKECLLTNQVLLKTLTKLMGCCLKFEEEMKARWEGTGVDEDKKKVAVEERLKRMNLDPRREGGIEEKRREGREQRMRERYDERLGREKRMGEGVGGMWREREYDNMVERFGQNFDSLLGVFTRRLASDQQKQYHSHLTNLSTRLDYNGFWSATQDEAWTGDGIGGGK
jgi:gamma-tubulin complex component 2